MISGMATMISGYSIGETAGQLIGYMDEYDDNETNEGSQKTDSGNVDADGTSVGEDIKYHLITSFYALLVLEAISIGG